jgi:gamma-glutamylcyclotransferase (GGCT)/AIG2-like uncharacterized protein YtfP
VILENIKMPKLHDVYVYGTLRLGDNEVYHIPGKIYDLGWFPGALIDESSDRTFRAEKIKVTTKQLKVLDTYEGYDEAKPEASFFKRIVYKGGWIYQFNGIRTPDDIEIPSGDWLEYADEKVGCNADILGPVEADTGDCDDEEIETLKEK